MNTPTPLRLSTKVINRPRCGIVFRVVDVNEQQAIAHKIQNLAGLDAFNKGVFQVRTGLWHVMDDSHMSHSSNRHSDPHVEAMRGQLPLSLDDFHRIPEVIRPRNIVEFAFIKRMP